LSFLLITATINARHEEEIEMMKRGIRLCLGLAAALALGACDDSSPDADADGGTDADTDADTDSDSDTDTDTDTDADAGMECSISVGPAENSTEVFGTCQTSPDACAAGYDPGDQAGTCDDALTCCVDLGACEFPLNGTCAASADECTGAAPPLGFPEFGCPEETPVCCLPAGPGDAGPP
jgi:hypothetical protein